MARFKLEEYLEETDPEEYNKERLSPITVDVTDDTREKADEITRPI